MRYEQLVNFKEIGPKGHQTLATKTVSVIGLGSIGSTAATMLIRSGVSLRLIDKGRCFVKDLSSQTLYLEEDHERFKAKQAKKYLEKINPGVKVKTFHEDLTKNNVFLVDADVVVDVTGNPEASKLISDYAKKKKLPLIFALASASQGLVATSDKGINLDKLKKITDKIKPVDDVGLINPAVYMAAAIIVSNIFKILLKKPYHKDAVLFDTWTDSIKRQKL
ncbi:MAG TPA: ThiF family adenylyltransferase [Candidatus Nanoarchaeia archaeon]|nr:ThiF family adenylyltransferase [Candidatus Nanoarchaeia archaeon]